MIGTFAQINRWGLAVKKVVRSLAAGLLLVGLSSTQSTATVIRFDDVGSGSVINTIYAPSGVTLGCADGSLYQCSGNAYAQAYWFAESDVNIASITPQYSLSFDSRMGYLTATFSPPISFVNVDAQAILPPEYLSTPSNKPFMQVYNSSGALLGSVYYPGDPELQTWEPLSFGRWTDDIAYVQISSTNGIGSTPVYGIFDNLQYSTSPWWSTLTITKSGTGGGTVTSSPSGINCGNTCSGNFRWGMRVALRVNPDPGSTFDGWTGDDDCSDGDVFIDASSDPTCTAIFTRSSLVEGGQAYSWGQDVLGYAANQTPLPVNGLPKIVAMDGGNFITVALDENGGVWSWGSWFWGDIVAPAAVSGLTSGVVAVAAGFDFGLALKSDGTVWSWGANDNGQLGNGTTNPSITPVKVGIWSKSAVVAIDAGTYHSLALLKDGTVRAWGRNLEGQLGTPLSITSASSPTQVKIKDVVKIAAGGYHSMGLLEDGTVRAWGRNDAGQLGDGTETMKRIPIPVPGLTDVTSIVGGLFHSLAIDRSGSLWAWGSNYEGQIGNGNFFEKVTTPYRVDALTNVVAVAGGGNHTLALTSDGALWSWGFNFVYQLGDGTDDSRLTPGRVDQPFPALYIAAGYDHSLAIGAPPDLVITGITASPSSPTAGQTVTMTIAIANQGSVAAGQFFVDFYKNRSTAPAAFNIGDGSCRKTGLAAGASDNCVVSVSYAGAGTYNMWAQIDTDQEVAEYSESNNVFGPQSLVVQSTAVPITVTTSPAGRQITVDSVSYVAPQTFNWQPGSSHTVGVTSPQSGATGIQYVYSSWSDSGAMSHTITTPSGAATYTATFTTQYRLTTAVNPAGTGSVSPSCLSGCWYSSGASVTLTPTPITDNSFSFWSGGHSGTISPAYLTMNAAKAVTANFVALATPLDLVVSALTVTGTAVPGALIDVKDTTKNNGPNPAPASVTKLYWSTNTTLDAGDVEIGSRAVPLLASPGSSVVTTQVTVPPGSCSGTYYIIARADAGGTVPETNESNNTRYGTVKVGPDLVVNVLTGPSPAVAGAGQTLGLNFTTKNSGGCLAGASTTKFYLSTNSSWDAADTELGSRGVGALAAGGEVSDSLNVTIPADTATGTRYLIAKADALGGVTETIETNNTKYWSLKVGPDLGISSLTGPTLGGAGQFIAIAVTTKNSGGGSAGASRSVCYLSINSTWDAADVPIGSRDIGPLAANISDVATINVLIQPGTAPGVYYIIAKADDLGAVVETSETNNTRYKTITIGPDLLVYSITAPTSAARGATIQISDTTRNSGGGGTLYPSATTIALSTNTTYEPGVDLVFYTRHFPALPGLTSDVGQPVTVTVFSWLAPGTYYLVGVADIDNDVAEVKEINNTKYKTITIN